MQQAEAIRRLAPPVPILASLVEAEDIPAAIRHLKRACRPIAAALQEATEAKHAFLEDIGAHAFSGLSSNGEEGPAWQQLVERLSAAHADLDGMRLHADLLRYLRQAEDASLRFIFDGQAEANKPIQRLGDIYELCLLRSLLTEHLKSDGEFLDKVGGQTLAQARDRFRQLDPQLQELEAARIFAERLGDRVPPGVDAGPKKYWTDLSLIRQQMGSKRHIQIRQLVSRASGALQALKPVWLMSPHSLAQFVPPDTATFDLIIIDEASQMRPEFAAGALARAGQMVVVGDEMQLPPTDFFSTSTDGDGDDEDAPIDAGSILNLALGRLSRRRRLKWHYRSQHPSLIQFSNRRFYGGSLVVFPSANLDDDVLGVSHLPVSGTYEAKINQTEAKAVIEKAVGLMYTRPELPLGNCHDEFGTAPADIRGI